MDGWIDISSLYCINNDNCSAFEFGGNGLILIHICEIYQERCTHNIWTKIKTKQSQKNLYIQQTADASWSFIMLMNLPVLTYVERPMPCMLNTRQATLMQFPSCNLPLMEPVICSFWCRDPRVTKRPLNHFESSRPKTWEALALTAIVAQITRAAPIWALQHNCLFSKQKIPCSANRFRFRPSALWAGNPIEIKRELVNYMQNNPKD